MPKLLPVYNQGKRVLIECMHNVMYFVSLATAEEEIPGSALGEVQIALIVFGSTAFVLMAILLVFIGSAFSYYYFFRKERMVRDAPMPPPFRWPAPPGDDESQTVTVPIEYIH